MKTEGARARRMAPLDTPSDLAVDAKQEISAALTTLLADMFALYVKTEFSLACLRSTLPRLSSDA